MLFVQDERALLFLFLKLGPALILWGHSIVEIQGDVFLFGGFGSGSYNSAIYQLSCSSGICSLATLKQALKLWRRYTVAITVPDSFCLEEGNGTTPCTVQGWIGDNFCDDVTNNIGCNFDGGDCCGANVNTEYCSACLCLESGGGGIGGTTTSSITTSSSGTTSTTSGGCNQGWTGDGYCDDINNNVGCNFFDGGDCCGANVNTQYCTECLCLE